MTSAWSVVPVLMRIADRIGARIEVEPHTQEAGSVIFHSGKRSHFWYNRFELNPIPIARICQDKNVCAYFLGQGGINVPRHIVICADSRRHYGDDEHGIEAGRRFIQRMGFPVVVKPLTLSKGALVHIAHDIGEFEDAVHEIFDAMVATRRRRLAMVQEYVPSPEYRVVVLEGEVIAAYRRCPLELVGDGKTSVQELLVQLRLRFVKDGRDPAELPITDKRIDATLARHNLSRSAVLAKGSALKLLEVANLSLGGSAVDCFNELHPNLKALACRVARTLHLSFAGIDFFFDDIRSPDSQYSVIEVNSAPGLDDAVFAGEAQEQRIDRLYTLVLDAIERRVTLLGLE